PAEIFLGEHRATPELLAKVREDMGLNKPIVEQYLSYMGNALQGNLGKSLNNGRPVLDEIMTRLPSTLELTLSAMIISTILGLGLGILAALRHNTIVDTTAMFLALIGISMPVFWSALMLIVIFAVNLKWFPPIGQGGLDRLVLPSIALGMLSAATLARMVRS